MTAEPRPDVPDGIVDTHCHLFLMDGDAGAVVRGAVEEGVWQMVCAGIDPESTRRSIDLAEQHEAVFATSGMHPHTASALDDAGRAEIERLAGHEGVVAIGETGLDYFRMLSPREDQLASFRWQIGLSNETRLPVVVHVRDAWDDALRVLAEERAERAVIHCFSGGPEEAEECAARGYAISFAANLTYRKNEHLRIAAAAVADSALVVETDSPFLPPERLRGRENVPGNVWEAAAALAEARREDHASTARGLADNARRVFGLPAP